MCSAACMGLGFGVTPPGTPERRAISPVPHLSLHDYWPSVSSVSDNDDVDVVLDYNVNNDVQLNVMYRVIFICYTASSSSCSLQDVCLLK